MTEKVERLTMSVAEAAEELGVSTATAYTLVHRADFPALWIGKRVRVSREGLREWVRMQAQNRNAAPGGANTQSGTEENRFDQSCFPSQFIRKRRNEQ